LEVLLSNGLIFHAIDLNRGGTGKSVHVAMATGASGAEQAKALAPAAHQHSHSHKHRQDQMHSHDHAHGHHHQAPTPRTVVSNDPSKPGELPYVCAGNPTERLL
jgi:gephyrin